MTYAVSLARALGGALTLMYVMQPHQLRKDPAGGDAISWEIARQEAQGYLERCERETSLALGRAVDVRLEQGQPAERIVELERELSSAVTVIGSHGDSGVTKWTLGSTVQQVLAMARGSVLVVHAAEATLASPKRILVPLDGSLRAESVIPTAVRMADTYGADVLLVHVVQELLTSSVLYSAEDLELARTLAVRLDASACNYLTRLARTASEGAHIRILVVRHANTHQCLIDIAQDEKADLVVLSAHGSTCDSGRSFGNVTAYQLTHSKVPVLVLQDLPDYGAYRSDLRHSTPPPSPLRGSFAPGRA